ncbi:MAG: lysozyme [Propionicimonas sp.]
MRAPQLRKLIAVASVAAIAALATATSSAGATAPDTNGPAAAPQPNAAARQAGIAAPGDAYMGWSKHTTPPSSTAKPAPAVAPSLVAAQTQGMDVSKWQGTVAWQTWYNSGMRFAYVKATEGTTYKSATFSAQYTGSYNVGMIRGSYHFALPNNSTGASQANYFVDNGGGWSADGKTLPGALDIEYNPYGATCYGLSQASMVSWIKAFSNQYKARTGRDPVIYSTTDWWTTCTGNSTAFNTINPLWVARYASAVGTLPGGWPYQTIWQYTSDGNMDKNWFNGPLSGVQALANG